MTNDLALMKDVLQGGAPLAFLVAVVVLWRQVLLLQAKYEALLRETVTALSTVAKELERDHESK